MTKEVCKKIWEIMLKINSMGELALYDIKTCDEVSINRTV